MSKYAISRAEAIKRLRHRWLSQVAGHPELPTIFPLSHFLTAENVRVVRRLGLYAYYSTPRHLAPVPEANRGQALIMAWMHCRPGSVQ